MRLADLAGALGLVVDGDGGVEISGLAGLEDAGLADLSFVTGENGAVIGSDGFGHVWGPDGRRRLIQHLEEALGLRGSDDADS